MKRAIKAPFVRSAVIAEARRARRYARAIDRQGLRDQTGLSWQRLERAIARANIELDSAVSPATADGSAKGGRDAKTCPEVPPPFPLPITTERQRQWIANPI